ncbi:MAG: aspartate-semialdehyde dehydrogenase [Chlamydiales bacterium]|nr:aspartate-semialdehyde dehydrogenase [Chlamydiales bacterium]
MNRIPVGILGATGVVGQHYIAALADHPWFEIAFLASSKRSANQSYANALGNRWRQVTPLPIDIANLPVHNVDDIAAAKASCRLVFSALGGEVAQQFEAKYAQEGLAVVSNASFHRRDPDVPVIIPEVNAGHLDILPRQRELRGWKGFIVTKPNCSLQSYLIPLWPLHQRFGLSKIIVTTLQAISGAGYPGVPALAITDNVIPYIAGEEEKSESEPLKILGSIKGDVIVDAENIAIAAHCNRVPVTDGHLACVSVQFKNIPSPEDIIQAWKDFKAEPQHLGLPSAPSQPIIIRDEFDRPQPRLDSMAGEGMAVTVGRLRPCPVLDYRFVGLSHNTIRGAAGGGVLIAELLVKQQYITV